MINQWYCTPVSDYFVKYSQVKPTRVKSLSLITHGIKPQCQTILWNITQGEITQGKSLGMITHGIIPQCRTSLKQITQGKMNKGKINIG